MTPNDFDRAVFPDRRSHLLAALDQRPTQGDILEFGVYRGRSLRTIARHVQPRRVYGFDSFRGLPETWVRSATKQHPAGHFRTARPNTPGNVTLVAGEFDESLPRWQRWRGQHTVAFLHIDCDIYSSAATVLRYLNPAIVPGTIIVFDELCDFGNTGYDRWADGEWKALQEWIQRDQRTVQPISRTSREQAAIRVTR